MCNVDRPGEDPQRDMETILLLEDDDVIRDLSSLYLRKLGYTVVEARDGDEAIALFDSDPGAIDLLVMDIVFPGVPVSELCKHMLHKRPHLKAVLMSGCGKDIIEQKGIPEIDFIYIEKPFSLKELLAAIREALEG